ncbi:hypothetical protein [Bradyrhizobium sp. NP1]|uniref:tetratricopeptide repeat protein n=1 Tax=Bradyrhizobium sp. NP1 TaxID=3049772 RepID=UPI0025A532FA|nr:hypothetical protein [Bradyrhizobium sp. NP1]WJR76462.1 hypothetical protein QOU61_27415 [Bradyrhizobium sp. NP1]
MQIIKWVEELRTKLSLDETIDAVSARMLDAHDEGHLALGLEIRWLLVEAERYQEALALLDELTERHPDNVRPLISKATLFLYCLEDLQEALKCIDLALDRAYRIGFFRREALGVKARILLQLGRGQQLSDVLEEIMSLKIEKHIPDIGRERDFIDNAPPGLIPVNVLTRYNQFRPKRSDE